MLRGRLGDVVDVVGAVGVGELLRGRVLDLGEDEGGERRGLRRGRGGAFREDRGVVGYARTKEDQQLFLGMPGCMRLRVGARTIGAA